MADRTTLIKLGIVVDQSMAAKAGLTLRQFTQQQVKENQAALREQIRTDEQSQKSALSVGKVRMTVGAQVARELVRQAADEKKSNDAIAASAVRLGTIEKTEADKREVSAKRREQSIGRSIALLQIDADKTSIWASRRVEADNRAARSTDARLRSEAASMEFATRQQRQLEQAEQRRQRQGSSRIASGLGTVGSVLTAGVTAPIVAAATYSVEKTLSWDEQFTEVKKFVSGSQSEIAKLKDDLRGLALDKTVGMTFEQVSQIAAQGGQLGVGVKDIKEFVRQVSYLGQAGNMSGEQAATGLAKIASALKLGQAELPHMVSSLVTMGTLGSSTVKEVVSIGQRFAATGREVGLTAAQIFAFANVAASMGQRAEAGGTALGKVFKRVDTAVATSNANLGIFASVAGMTSDEFSKAFRDDASGAMQKFFIGLDKLPPKSGEALKALKALGSASNGESTVMLNLAAGHDLLAQALQKSSSAYNGASVAASRAEVGSKSYQRELDHLHNQIDDTANILGEALIPALSDALKATEPIRDDVRSLAEAFHNLSPEARQIWVAIALGVAATGPALIGIGKMVEAINTLRTGYIAFQALLATRGLATAATEIESVAVATEGATEAATKLAPAFSEVESATSFATKGFLAQAEALAKQTAEVLTLQNALGALASTAPITIPILLAGGLAYAVGQERIDRQQDHQDDLSKQNTPAVLRQTISDNRVVLQHANDLLARAQGGGGRVHNFDDDRAEIQNRIFQRATNTSDGSDLPEGKDAIPVLQEAIRRLEAENKVAEVQAVQTQRRDAINQKQNAAGLRALEIGSANVSGLTMLGKERLGQLDTTLHDMKQSGVISSAKRDNPGVKSDHNNGTAVDIVVKGNMAEVAEVLRSKGFDAHFETKGQRNANGSVATGDHIHVSLSPAGGDVRPNIPALHAAEDAKQKKKKDAEDEAEKDRVEAASTRAQSAVERTKSSYTETLGMLEGKSSPIYGPVGQMTPTMRDLATKASEAVSRQVYEAETAAAQAAFDKAKTANPDNLDNARAERQKAYNKAHDDFEERGKQIAEKRLAADKIIAEIAESRADRAKATETDGRPTASNPNGTPIDTLGSPETQRKIEDNRREAQKRFLEGERSDLELQQVQLEANRDLAATFSQRVTLARTIAQNERDSAKAAYDQAVADGDLSAWTNYQIGLRKIQAQSIQTGIAFSEEVNARLKAELEKQSMAGSSVAAFWLSRLNEDSRAGRRSSGKVAGDVGNAITSFHYAAAKAATPADRSRIYQQEASDLGNRDTVATLTPEARKQIMAEMASLHDYAMKTGDGALLSLVDNAVKELKDEMPSIARVFADESGRILMTQIGQYADRLTDVLAHQLLGRRDRWEKGMNTGKAIRQAGDAFVRDSAGGLVRAGVSGAEESIGKSVHRYLGRQLGGVNVGKELAKDIQRAAQYLKIGGKDGGKGLLEGAAAVYTAASSLEAAFGKGHKHRYGGLIGSIIGGVAGSFIGGPGGGWKIGSALGGQIGGLASFDSGSWELPRNMIAQVHKGEMIIPARQAEAIRSGAGVGGEVHTHYHTHTGPGMQVGTIHDRADADHMMSVWTDSIDGFNRR